MSPNDDAVADSAKPTDTTTTTTTTDAGAKATPPAPKSPAPASEPDAPERCPVCARRLNDDGFCRTCGYQTPPDDDEEATR